MRDSFFGLRLSKKFPDRAWYPAEQITLAQHEELCVDDPACGLPYLSQTALAAVVHFTARDRLGNARPRPLYLLTSRNSQLPFEQLEKAHRATEGRRVLSVYNRAAYHRLLHVARTGFDEDDEFAPVAPIRSLDLPADGGDVGTLILGASDVVLPSDMAEHRTDNTVVEKHVEVTGSFYGAVLLKNVAQQEVRVDFARSTR